MSEVQLLVGTQKGAFILDSDADRRDWSVRGPLCEGWPIHDLIVEPATGAILAAGGSPWYGPAVWRSEDDGADLDALVRGPDLRRRTARRRSPTIWSLATGPDGTLYAGVEPAGPLPQRRTAGATWTHVEGLTNHPTRPTWQPGAGGLILHTIIPHPTDPSGCGSGSRRSACSRRATAG